MSEWEMRPIKSIRLTASKGNTMRLDSFFNYTKKTWRGKLNENLYGHRNGSDTH